MIDICDRLRAELMQLRLAGRRPRRILVTAQHLAAIEASCSEEDRGFKQAVTPSDDPTFTGVAIAPELTSGPAEIICDAKAGAPTRIVLADA